MNKHRRTSWPRRLAVAAIVAALATTGAAAVASDTVVAPSADGSQVRISSCVIRLYTSGPQMYENDGHACLGVTSVRINTAGNLEISRTSGGPIAYVSAAADETLARRGIIAGASGGLGTTVIVLYDTDTGRRVRPDSTAVASSQSNLWLLWIEYVG